MWIRLHRSKLKSSTKNDSKIIKMLVIFVASFANSAMLGSNSSFFCRNFHEDVSKFCRDLNPERTPVDLRKKKSLLSIVRYLQNHFHFLQIYFFLFLEKRARGWRLRQNFRDVAHVRFQRFAANQRNFTTISD